MRWSKRAKTLLPFSTTKPFSVVIRGSLCSIADMLVTIKMVIPTRCRRHPDDNLQQRDDPYKVEMTSLWMLFHCCPHFIHSSDSPQITFRIFTSTINSCSTQTLKSSMKYRRSTLAKARAWTCKLLAHKFLKASSPCKTRPLFLSHSLPVKIWLPSLPLALAVCSTNTTYTHTRSHTHNHSHSSKSRREPGPRVSHFNACVSPPGDGSLSSWTEHDGEKRHPCEKTSRAMNSWL